MNLPNLQKKLIRHLKKHVSSGYYPDKARVECVIQAILCGKIRVSKEEDDRFSYRDLAGDCFNPRVVTDIPHEQLKRQEMAFKARIRNSGVWTMVSEYWTGREWESFVDLRSNSICGFVGDDFFGSGYELDLMREALEAYNRQPLDGNGFVIDPYLRAA